MIAVKSFTLAKLPNLASFLGASVTVFPSLASNITAAAGWGMGPRALAAKRYAVDHGLPYLSVEEGFFASSNLRGRTDPVFSLLIDATGVHYDASRPSDLETLLNTRQVSADERDRAARAVARLQATKLSKYGQGCSVSLSGTEKQKILLIDQVQDDASLRYGGADAATFQAMAKHAMSLSATHEVYFKPHPATQKGRKGSLTQAMLPGCHVLPPEAAIQDILQQVDLVMVATSQVGLEAILAGKEVLCFGQPFYSGWGLTKDLKPVSRRTRKLSVLDLAYLAYLAYPTYVHPITGARCELEDILTHVELNLACQLRDPVLYVGFQKWKHDVVRTFAGDAQGLGLFFSTAKEAVASGVAGKKVYVWGHRVPDYDIAAMQQAGAEIVRVEDGFLRSVGLGSDLVAPQSLVFDEKGIYYDSRTPSSLEHLLDSVSLTADQNARASALRESILANKVSKYNFASRPDQQSCLNNLISKANNKKIILVPGQVADDASILFGQGEFKTLPDMLAVVRRENPDAFVIYRPHPDVLSGNRAGDDHACCALCDHVETQLSTLDCLDLANEVHAFTSLVGFEALLRNKKVVVYGCPFYAGWSLTEDRSFLPRRTRKLSINELIWGALVAYPRYYDWDVKAFSTPEAVIHKLSNQRVTHSVASGYWPRRARQFKGLVTGWMRAA
jgi:capsular polysaccharide export protein